MSWLNSSLLSIPSTNLQSSVQTQVNKRDHLELYCASLYFQCTEKPSLCSKTTPLQKRATFTLSGAATSVLCSSCHCQERYIGMMLFSGWCFCLRMLVWRSSWGHGTCTNGDNLNSMPHGVTIFLASITSWFLCIFEQVDSLVLFTVWLID